MVIRNKDNEKVMMTIDKDVCDLIRQKAFERRMSFHEIVRLIFGEWFIAHGEDYITLPDGKLMKKLDPIIEK